MTVADALPHHVPVLIAGAGPVGLAVAMELEFHGVECLVVEPRGAVSWLRPRAKTTSTRTMEHFRRWGLAEALRKGAPLPVSWSDEAVFCTSLTGREITRFTGCLGLDLTGSDLAAEPGQQVPQPVVEDLMRQTVGPRLATGYRVNTVAQDADGATVEVIDEQGVSHTVRADYVVGCEGGRSVVRAALGAKYEGVDTSRPNLSIVFRAPELAEHVAFGPAVHYWVLNPDQPGLIGRLDLDDTWWCIAQGVEPETCPLTPAELVHAVTGADVEVEILATDAWRARMLLASEYGHGRLFIAGDAAHQNPPWGGHGFNTGIGDAVNLGWKLAAVVNGWAPAELLESYGAERRPIAAQTIDEAAQNMSTLAPELSDPRLFGSDAEFQEAVPAVAAAVQTSKAQEFHSLPLTLGYHYAGSPIVADEPGAATPSEDRVYRPTAAPGHRLPHRWLAEGDSLYDRLGPEFTLVGDLSSPEAASLLDAARAASVPVAELDLRGPEWVELFGAPLVLVRPDQHVAWRGSDVPDAAAIVRRAVGAA
ncbi:FAD-dependent monooxygenase [Actinocorallia sp. A-T 12471]|uniref:FAD-dependent monooxygenase n=1 Tax=Actinocorallia sp. A-T 12471 TaxID=3089813 RepID=UPI0029D33470|nr:FAD-dependent monooxygenase [Actinocorallia sp. A-T 12471]MDX6742446.1 FAD-dependent monooxygenase [Actinocorallia sp. A-T 12471]